MSRLTLKKFDRNVYSINRHQSHVWVTVINPLNSRSLLQACDNCGVVKSENSIARACKAQKGSGLISSALKSNIKTAV